MNTIELPRLDLRSLCAWTVWKVIKFSKSTFQKKNCFVLRNEITQTIDGAQNISRLSYQTFETFTNKPVCHSKFKSFLQIKLLEFRN